MADLPSDRGGQRRLVSLRQPPLRRACEPDEWLRGRTSVSPRVLEAARCCRSLAESRARLANALISLAPPDPGERIAPVRPRGIRNIALQKTIFALAQTDTVRRFDQWRQFVAPDAIGTRFGFHASPRLRGTKFLRQGTTQADSGTGRHPRPAILVLQLASSDRRAWRCIANREVFLLSIG